MKKLLLIFIILTNIQPVFAFSKVKHILAQEAVSDLSLKKGGLGGHLSFVDLIAIQSYMDQQPKGISSISKRHLPTHNPRHVAEIMSTRGMHYQAVYNAAVIHIILDMAHSGPTGVNGHECTKKNRKTAQKAYDRIKKGKSYKIPFFAKKAGPLAKKVSRITYIKYGKKVLKKITKPIQYIVIAYEIGKVIKLKAIDNEELDYKLLSKKGGEAIGGIGGMITGGIIGTYACAPFSETGVLYFVCVSGFVIVGSVAGEYLVGEIVEISFEYADAYYKINTKKYELTKISFLQQAKLTSACEYSLIDYILKSPLYSYLCFIIIPLLVIKFKSQIFKTLKKAYHIIFHN